MEKQIESHPKSPISSENNGSDRKTPMNSLINSSNGSGKTNTPDRLTLPKAFKYPERYTSPTDLMMSPVSKGLLARSRKSSMPLPPTKNQPKIQDLHFKDVGLTQS